MTERNRADKNGCLKEKQQYPWAEYMTEEDFISAGPSYESGKYLPLFEDKVFHTGDSRVGDLRYFVYDPTLHGFPKGKEYPVLFALHGAGGSLVGKMAVNWAGGEMFASPEMQEKLGGAYIIAPIANEYYDCHGEQRMTWMTPVEGQLYEGYDAQEKEFAEGLVRSGWDIAMLFGHPSVYTDSLLRLLKQELKMLDANGPRILMGASAGGYAAWRLMLAEPGYFAAVLMMAGAYLPSRKELDVIDRSGTRLWIVHAKHDECVPYDEMILPILPRLEQMKRVEFYCPELARRADGGVAVNMTPIGFQMGQHCINDLIQEDLLWLDGTPMDPAHPGGVTGWINSIR